MRYQVSSNPVGDSCMETVTVKVIDLFSGIGGLTHGFFVEGFDVVAGVDNDESCRYGFEWNNNSKFICKDIALVTPDELQNLYGAGAVRVLIGCAPCQPFSSLSQRRGARRRTRPKQKALKAFLDLTLETLPEIVSMENVPELANAKRFRIFDRLVTALKDSGYWVSYKVIDASEYGVPQRRRRLVLLASRLGPISLIPATHAGHPRTVKDCIKDLPAIRAGQRSTLDEMHTASRLSAINLCRIKATPTDGGGAKDWDENLLPKCFRKRKGRSYKASVYGRMRWGQPAPTMTTNCTTLGTGRFGHPTQRRAISLREAARFQTFPDYYLFYEFGKMKASQVAKHIGNAVPVRLAQVIAASVKTHLALYIPPR